MSELPFKLCPDADTYLRCPCLHSTTKTTELVNVEKHSIPRAGIFLRAIGTYVNTGYPHKSIPPFHTIKDFTDTFEGHSQDEEKLFQTHIYVSMSKTLKWT